MSMQGEDRAELYGIVREAIDKYGHAQVSRCISEANNWGRVDGFVVTTDNMHLFRQFRNTNFSADNLVEEATK